jgi:hypothetical protein
MEEVGWILRCDLTTAFQTHFRRERWSCWGPKPGAEMHNVGLKTTLWRDCCVLDLIKVNNSAGIIVNIDQPLTKVLECLTCYSIRTLP